MSRLFTRSVKRPVRRLSAVLLLLSLLAVFMVPAASADAGTHTAGGCTVLNDAALPREDDSVTLTVHRGGSLDLFSPWNENKLYCFVTVANKYLPVKALKLDELGKKAKIRVSSGSWLTAKIKSKQLKVTLKGQNKTQATKSATATIKDQDGAYASLRFTRGGANRFTAIQQNGKTIRLKIKFASAANKTGYIHLTVFDEHGKKVELSEPYLTNKKKITGSVYVDDMTELKAGYTYAYTIGYIPAGMNHANASWAAAIRLKNDSGSQSGKTAYCYKHDFDDKWLYKLAK